MHQIMTRKTELAGKVAVIAGAGSEIGAATARLLAAAEPRCTSPT